MRKTMLVSALVLLAAPGGAAASPVSDRLESLARKTQAISARAADAALDEAAAYWFARDRSGTRSLAGTAPALAAAIRLARADALRSGTKPLPASVKRGFRQHYSAEVLDDVRWIVAAPGSRLGQLLARWPAENGAVTLHDVIVFKTAAAAGSRRLLAHELTHVEQYRKFGIDGFAKRYAANRAAMEREAHSKADAVVKRA